MLEVPSAPGSPPLVRSVVPERLMPENPLVRAVDLPMPVTVPPSAMSVAPLTL